MTKDQYLEMCEMLGNEPIEEQIPVEIDEFPELIQTTIAIYYMLNDIWDPMGGNYLGKDTHILFNLFNLYKFNEEEQLIAIPLLKHMDSIRSKMIASKQSKTKPAS